MVEWVEVARETDIPDNEGRAFTVKGLKIAIFRVDGDLYAIDDTCPHAKTAQLSMGFLDGAVVECPLHQSCFDVRTGKVLSAPATEDVRTYPVRVEAGAVQLQV